MYIRLFVTAASTTSLFWMSRNTDKGDLNSSNQEVLRMAHNFAKHLPFPEAEGRKKKRLKEDSLTGKRTEQKQEYAFIW